jgi:hypothetical protein
MFISTGIFQDIDMATDMDTNTPMCTNTDKDLDIGMDNLNKKKLKRRKH